MPSPFEHLWASSSEKLTAFVLSGPARRSHSYLNMSDLIRRLRRFARDDIVSARNLSERQSVADK
jgi:hypothetical protein